jgi:Surface-adhesin protein E
MKRVFLIALLVLNNGAAYAEWVEVDRDDRTGMTLYVDPDTIRRRADLVAMWALYDYKAAQHSAGDSYLSRKVQSEYNCTEEVRRMLEVTQFSGNMGSGKIVHMKSYLFSTEARWAPARSGGETLLKVACGKR